MAGTKYPESEKSFRQTLSFRKPTCRGFFVDIDGVNERVIVRFDPSSVSEELAEWKNTLPEYYDEDYAP